MKARLFILDRKEILGKSGEERGVLVLEQCGLLPCFQESPQGGGSHADVSAW